MRLRQIVSKEEVRSPKWNPVKFCLVELATRQFLPSNSRTVFHRNRKMVALQKKVNWTNTPNAKQTKLAGRRAGAKEVFFAQLARLSKHDLKQESNAF